MSYVSGDGASLALGDRWGFLRTRTSPSTVNSIGSPAKGSSSAKASDLVARIDSESSSGTQ